MPETYLTVFPHTCVCGRSYDREGWLQLPYVGVGYTPVDCYGPAESLEYRNCTCGSTIVVPITVRREHSKGWTPIELVVPSPGSFSKHERNPA